MNVAADHLAPDKVARITGGFYLAYIVASVLATVLGQIGLGDSAAGLPGDRHERGVVPPGSRRRVDVGLPLPHGRLGSLRAPATGQQEPGAALPAAQRRRCRHPGREHVVAGLRAAAGRRGQPHAGLLGGTAGGAGVPVHQRLQDGLGHGPAVLRHVAVPARLPGLQVRVPSPVPGRPPGARRDRRPGLVPPGPAAAGLPRDPLPRARRELRRRSSGWHCGSSSRA